MFTAYIDDAGTAPEHKVAIATALVLPTLRIQAFHAEWNTLVEKWGISDFHASECAIPNKKSDFAGWDKEKIRAGFTRIRQITRKYGLTSYSLAVHKSDYEAIVPVEQRVLFGQYHFTYAIQNLLGFLDNWACQSGVEQRLEFVFDWMDPKTQKLERQEVENAVARSEEARPGRFADHYSFRRRQENPGLQCVDLIGWACYRFAVETFGGRPSTELQTECWKDFSSYKNGRWLTAIGQTKEQIQEAVESLKRYESKNPLQVSPHIRGNG
jgi:hypothetical protein